ncbi:MAG TPA: Ada metal-binding domain-containing protein, partial [Kiloniellaceae bacterium]
MMLQAMTEPATPFASADARWEAFIGRDPAADGRFVTAVTSTGIYCRPTCSARKPRRENVRFYRTAVEAEAAGFRPCK